MSAETQVFSEADYSLEYALPSEGQTAELAKTTKAFFFSLTTVLESFWSFYEAMRLGKPLPDADEKLARMTGFLHLKNHD